MCKVYDTSIFVCFMSPFWCSTIASSKSVSTVSLPMNGLCRIVTNVTPPHADSYSRRVMSRFDVIQDSLVEEKIECDQDKVGVALERLQDCWLLLHRVLVYRQGRRSDLSPMTAMLGMISLTKNEPPRLATGTFFSYAKIWKSSCSLKATRLMRLSVRMSSLLRLDWCFDDFAILLHLRILLSSKHLMSVLAGLPWALVRAPAAVLVYAVLSNKLYTHIFLASSFLLLKRVNLTLFPTWGGHHW